MGNPDGDLLFEMVPEGKPCERSVCSVFGKNCSPRGTACQTQSHEPKTCNNSAFAGFGQTHLSRSNNRGGPYFEIQGIMYIICVSGARKQS